ncbi:MAG: hypothetical protein IRZ03_19010 [Acidobacterium ailaaui]|nr:hypothetical protein [Pseudacidobacterium ailaaui]
MENIKTAEYFIESFLFNSMEWHVEIDVPKQSYLRPLLKSAGIKNKSLQDRETILKFLNGLYNMVYELDASDELEEFWYDIDDEACYVWLAYFRDGKMKYEEISFSLPE